MKKKFADEFPVIFLDSAAELVEMMNDIHSDFARYSLASKMKRTQYRQTTSGNKRLRFTGARERERERERERGDDDDDDDDDDDFKHR